MIYIFIWHFNRRSQPVALRIGHFNTSCLYLHIARPSGAKRPGEPPCAVCPCNGFDCIDAGAHYGERRRVILIARITVFLFLCVVHCGWGKNEDSLRANHVRPVHDSRKVQQTECCGKILCLDMMLTHRWVSALICSFLWFSWSRIKRRTKEIKMFMSFYVFRLWTTMRLRKHIIVMTYRRVNADMC